MDKEQILKIAAANETPFYLYDLQDIRTRAAQVKAALPEFHLLYSIKANPHPAIVRCLVNMGAGFDAASVNEVRLALRRGSKPENVFYSAPGKTMRDLDAAAGNCEIIADSINELERLNSLAGTMKRRIRAGVRLNIRNPIITQSMHEIMGGERE